MIEITSTSKHGKDNSGSSTANGQIIGRTTLGHAQYSIAYGKGSKRQSITMHCSKQTADNKVKELQSQGH